MNHGLRKTQAKRAARLWILAAIQSRTDSPTKDVQREISRFIRRIQRDIKSLEHAEAEFEKSRKRELSRLFESQRADANDRHIRFENAIGK